MQLFCGDLKCPNAQRTRQWMARKGRYEALRVRPGCGASRGRCRHLTLTSVTTPARQGAACATLPPPHNHRATQRGNPPKNFFLRPENTSKLTTHELHNKHLDFSLFSPFYLFFMAHRRVAEPKNMKMTFLNFGQECIFYSLGSFSRHKRSRQERLDWTGNSCAAAVEVDRLDWNCGCASLLWDSGSQPRWTCHLSET